MEAIICLDGIVIAFTLVNDVGHHAILTQRVEY